MNVLDLIIAVVAIAYAYVGYRNGAIVGILSLTGFLGGAVIGAQVARPVVSRVVNNGAQIPVAIICVLMFATAGQVIGSLLGRRLRGLLVSRRSRWGTGVDSVIGAVVSAVSVLLVAWIVAVPLASAPYPTVASEVQHSSIVRGVDTVMPEDVRGVYSSLRGFLDRSGFPPVFGTLPSAPDVTIAAPDALSAELKQQSAAAHPSVLKIYSQAPSCDRAIEGSGFVVADQRVVTNAHVVAGTSTVAVQLPSGRSLPARVVVFDPKRDVAVLLVPGLKAPALKFAAEPAKRGDDSAVLGYPEDGPYTVRAARVGTRETIRGNDIYGGGDVHREIYALRAVVRSGNSGGPLISADGNVLGIVFATALDANDVGYALTDSEIRPDVSAGLTANEAAATGHCASG